MEPPIDPGCEGVVETDTANVRAVLVPQKLLAVTDMSPSLAPTVALIDVEVELPPHPEGKLQVYEVAPGTALML